MILPSGGKRAEEIDVLGDGAGFGEGSLDGRCGVVAGDFDEEEMGIGPTDDGAGLDPREIDGVIVKGLQEAEEAAGFIGEGNDHAGPVAGSAGYRRGNYVEVREIGDVALDGKLEHVELVEGAISEGADGCGVGIG